MKLPHKKFLLRPDTILEVGDIVSEINRFTGHHKHYKIQGFSPDKELMYLQCIDNSRDKLDIGHTVMGEVRCHTKHNNCTVLTYKIPELSILYGAAKTQA